MEEMFAGFAADREAARYVSAGSEAALDGVADGLIFLLHFFADLDAGLVFLRGLFAHVRKVIVEDDGALIHRQRHHQVRVHHAFIGVEHEVRIDPQIERAALARGRNARFGFGV